MDKDQDRPHSAALAANMKRLMRARGISSIGQLRSEMSQAGHPIGTGTLHKAVQGKLGNRLASLEKIATFFDLTAEQLLQPEGVSTPIWPFSLELHEEVLRLPQAEVQHLEVAMWAHVRKALPSELHYPEQYIRELSKPDHFVHAIITSD